MKCQVIGISRRQSTNQQTGAVSIWTSLHCIVPFSDYELEHGAQGYKPISVNTRLNTTHININDNVVVNYEPTGFRDKNGSPEFTVASIEVIEQKK